MIISFTCDLDLKLQNVNLVNVFKKPNDIIKESFPLQPFVSKFQDFEIFI